MTHIFLIGFMATGKSTVAKELALALGWPHIELDQQIVKHIKMDIPTLFRTQGERVFRDLETEFLQSTTQGGQGVVSCGGGIILRPENVKYMQQKGVLVLLTATPETILKRIEQDVSRPLLKGHQTPESIGALMLERQGQYESGAEVVIATDYKSPKEICSEIISQLRTLEKL